MEPLEITFLESSADGLRLVRTENWDGRCLMLNRRHFLSAQKTEQLDRPGVYILVGASTVDTKAQPPRLVSQIYIGKSDVLDERLRQHYDNKLFWSTAFAFFRHGIDLNAGHIAQLESHLIKKALVAGNHVLANVQTPRKPGGAFSEESLDTFTRQIERMLKAIGHDFFTEKSLPASQTKQDLKPTAVDIPESPKSVLTVPSHLKAIVDQLEAWCKEFPAADFYSTATPDLRGKVAYEEHFRVFVRIQLQKHAVRIAMKDGPTRVIYEETDLSEGLRTELQSAHDQALRHLQQ